MAPVDRRWVAAATALAVFFAFWALCYPATFLVGTLRGHMPRSPPFVAADPASITRFAGSPGIRVLHALLGGAWSALVPLQLSSAVRKQRPRLHRMLGRVFFSASACVLAGYLLMEVSHKRVTRDHGLHRHTFYRPLAAWFGYTGLRAFEAAAVRRDLRSHAAFCIRHIGAGLVFALARVLVLLVGAALHYSGALDMAPLPNKLHVFYAVSYASAAVCVGGSELALRRAGLA